MEYKVIKYNYNNKSYRECNILVEGNKIFYNRRNNFILELKNVVGIIYGPLTCTWKYKNFLKQPYLCISFISHKRTYDFKFKTIMDLKLFLFQVKDIKVFDSMSNQLKQLHKYTPLYINHVIRFCKNNYMEDQHVSKQMFIDDILSNWDFDKNCIKPDINIIITDELLETVFNDSCYICLDSFVNNQSGLLFNCNHLYHTECLNEYNLISNKEIECVVCNN